VIVRGASVHAETLEVPILDLAVGLAPGTDPDRVVSAIERLGYAYRGDKGDTGGPPR
jgi:hypothetical protein